MIVELLTEYHLEFLSFKGGCGGSSESTHVKMPHCWKSHATAHLKVVSHESDDLLKVTHPPLAEMAMSYSSVVTPSDNTYR